MTSLAPSAIVAQFILSSTDADKFKGTITTYTGVVNQLLSRYDTEAVIAKPDKVVTNFKLGSVTP